MTNNNQTERVSDEELDQMILKLERDGMTPKQLSLMRELREVRREKGDGRDQFEEWMLKKWGRERQEYDFAMGKFLHGEDYADSYTRHMWKAWSASRAAMLQLSGNSEHLKPVSNRDELPTQSSNEVNDAAWKLYDMLTEHGPLNGYQFNNLKECFYEALKVAMRYAAPKEVG